MTWLYAGLALLSGAALAVQVGMNNGLTQPEIAEAITGLTPWSAVVS